MSRRGENIYKRKDGRWEGRYKTIKPNGQIKYVSVYAKSYLDIRKKLQNCKQNAQLSYDGLPECKLTVENLLLQWLRERKDSIKTSSYIRYQNLVYQHLLPVIGSLPVNQLTAQKLAAFLKQKHQAGRLDRKGGLAAKTVSDILVIIKSAVKAALIHYSLANAAAILDMKASVCHQKQIETFYEWEIKAINEKILQNQSLTNIAILLCLNTGLRLGEVCALRWEDIDFKAQTLTVRCNVQRVTQNGKSHLLIQTPKSENSCRIIPLTAQILLMFKQLKQAAGNEYIFGGHKPLEPRSMQYKFAALLKSSGIRQRNFHTLRHTFASRYIAAGGDIKSLSEILGHSNVRITMQLYVHPTMQQKLTCLENISTLKNSRQDCA